MSFSYQYNEYLELIQGTTATSSFSNSNLSSLVQHFINNTCDEILILHGDPRVLKSIYIIIDEFVGSNNNKFPVSLKDFLLCQSLYDIWIYWYKRNNIHPYDWMQFNTIGMITEVAYNTSEKTLLLRLDNIPKQILFYLINFLEFTFNLTIEKLRYKI